MAMTQVPEHIQRAIGAARDEASLLREQIRRSMRSRVGEPDGVRAMRFWLQRKLVGGRPPPLTYARLGGDTAYRPRSGEPKRADILHDLAQSLERIARKVRRELRASSAEALTEASAMTIAHALIDA